MDPRLLRPKWLLAHLVVLAIAMTFVWLGWWQLERHQERLLENRLGSQRLGAEPVELGNLVVTAGDDLDSIEHRIAYATGVFDTGEEVLIRSQVYRGAAGFHVVTPLVGKTGNAVLVNRGWVPLTMDSVPVEKAPPPGGEITVRGWVSLSRDRPPLGPVDSPGRRLTTMSRVDIDRIQLQIPNPLAPVFLVEVGEGGTDLPVPVPAPAFDDDGPHLAYAIQWFSFSLIGVIGYVFLMRRRIKGSG